MAKIEFTSSYFQGENFKMLHRTADGETEKMSEDQPKKPNFWENFNLKAAAFNYVAVAIFGFMTVYVTYALQQQKLNADIQDLKNNQEQMQRLNDERSAQRAAENKEIRETFKNEGVTEKILDLRLKPIETEQLQQRALLERIAIAVNAPPAVQK